MLAAGKLPQSGLTRQEDIKLPAFLENRFGRCYALTAPAAASATAAAPAAARATANAA
jgi:hypothetical protein